MLQVHMLCNTSGTKILVLVAYNYSHGWIALVIMVIISNVGMTFMLVIHLLNVYSLMHQTCKVLGAQDYYAV